jgi:transposase
VGGADRAPWRDFPEAFGNWFTVYTRFWRWAKKNVWEPGHLLLTQSRLNVSLHVCATIVHQPPVLVLCRGRVPARIGLPEKGQIRRIFLKNFLFSMELRAAKARGFTVDGRSATFIFDPGNDTHEASPGNIPNIILTGLSRAFIG